eukprot:CFRG2057T1
MVGQNPRARKSRRSRIKTTTRTRNSQQRHFRKVRIDNAVIAKGWDVTKTVKQNYAKLGLAMDLNKSTAIPQHRVQQKTDSMAMEEFERLRAEKTPTETVAELEKISKTETPKESFLSDGQQQIIKALVLKHGDDFKAMERDIKLNTHQKTKGQLRSLYKKYTEGLVPTEA